MENKLKMWIFCAGAKRSGSTLQYNLVSMVVECGNKGTRIPYYKPEKFSAVKRIYSESNSIKVFKTHKLTKEIYSEIKRNKAIVFYCYRDIRDVLVSFFNKGWLNRKSCNIEKFVNGYLRDYYIWNRSDITVYARRYEDFAFNIREEAHYIASILGIELTNEQVENIYNTLNIDVIERNQDLLESEMIQKEYSQKFSKDTLIHTNHINDGRHLQFIDKLERDQILRIEAIAWRWLLDHNYDLYWKKFNKILSFSQHGDDHIAWQLLGKLKKGIVVEVGAFDGIHFSNSYSLEGIGWKSICIEPNPVMFEYLRKNRPRAHNMNIAIVGNEEISIIDFYREDIGLLSGCSFNKQDVERRYTRRGLKYKEPEKIKIKASTLTRALDGVTNKIDLLSIDVEGFEIEVLKGFDIDRFNVGLFIIEANSKNEKDKILEYFADYRNYIHVGDNYQNLFILRKDLLLKRNVNKLVKHDYVRAVQYHPIDESMAIQSRVSSFVQSKACKKINTWYNYLYLLWK